MKVFGLFSILFLSNAEMTSVVRILDNPPLPTSMEILMKDVAVLENFSSDCRGDVENIKIADSEADFSQMTAQDLVAKIRSDIKRVEEQCGRKITLSLPRSLQHHTMQGDFSEEKVQGKILQALKSDCSTCEFEIEGLRVTHGQVPESYSTWELDHNIKNLRGPSVVSVYFDHQTLRPVVMHALVKARQPGWRLKKAMVQGTVPDAAQLESVMADVTYEQKHVAQISDTVSGELKRSLSSGQILYIEDLSERHIVRSGQPLSVEVTHGTFHIKVSGVAQRNGRRGDKIPVRVSKTRKDVLAEVIGEGLVRMQR